MFLDIIEASVRMWLSDGVGTCPVPAWRIHLRFRHPAVSIYCTTLRKVIKLKPRPSSHLSLSLEPPSATRYSWRDLRLQSETRRLGRSLNCSVSEAKPPEDQSPFGAFSVYANNNQNPRSLTFKGRHLSQFPEYDSFILQETFMCTQRFARLRIDCWSSCRFPCVYFARLDFGTHQTSILLPAV